MRKHVHFGDEDVPAAAGLCVLTMTFCLLAARALLAAGICWGLVPVAGAQGPASEFDGNAPFNADQLTTVDLQKALLWTGHYDSMVDGSYGKLTRDALASWQRRTGYAVSETPPKFQIADLIASGRRVRDRFGWTTLADPAVGFSVGYPAEIATPQAPSRSDGKIDYAFTGDIGFNGMVLNQGLTCRNFDAFYAWLQRQDEPGRTVLYSARKDNWLVVTGDFGNRRFYNRAECRDNGAVMFTMNVPLSRIEELGLLITAFSNSLRIDQQIAPLATPSVALSKPNLRSPVPPQAPPAVVSFPGRRDRLGTVGEIQVALGRGPELRPQDVFTRVAPSVYVVQSNNGRAGSAVAVSRYYLLTNCHVVSNASAIWVEREGGRTEASLLSADDAADRCVLRSAAPMADWVSVRPFSDLKIGERAFSVGAPRGLELTLAEGLISFKRTSGTARAIQTSAPISPGSSGGGLFDAWGNLVGITTMMLRDSQNLNFAIPAEDYVR